MRGSSLFASLALLTACGPAPTAPSAPAREATEGAKLITRELAPSSPGPTARAAVMPPVDDFRVPNERSCLLKAAKLGNAVLRLTRDGVDFARVEKVTDARVHVTSDPVGTGLVVELEKGPVALAGITRAEDMEIYAKQPIKLGGFFLPAGDTGLRISGASKGRVLLKVARTPFDLRHVTTMLESDVSCEAASLLATRVNPRASLGKAIAVSYLVGDAVPLSLTANGEPVATLIAGPPAAEILERAEGAARVAWPMDGGYVSGWVPVTHLGAKPPRSESGRGGFGVGEGGGGGSPMDRRICNRDVALGARVGDEARFVGRIRANALIEVWGSLASSEWTSVAIPAAEIGLLNGAGFFVRTSDIADCDAVPPARRTH